MIENRQVVIYRVLLVSSLLALMAVWAFSSRPGSYPDEQFHMVNTYCAGSHPANQCDEVDEEGLVRGPAAILDAKHWWWENPLVIRMADYRADNYSAVYYEVTSWLTTGGTAESIARVRIFNLLLAGTTIVIAFAVSHESVRNAYVLSLLLINITYGLYFASSNHPLSWAFSGVVAFSALLLSSIRHNELWWKAICGVVALVSAGIALSARRESVVALAFAVLMTVLLERNALKDQLKKVGLRWLTLASLALMLGLTLAIYAKLLRLIYPFNAKGKLLFTDFDLDRFVRNVSATPVVFLRVLAGTRDDKSLENDPFGYWLIPTLLLVVFVGTWLYSYSQKKKRSKVDNGLIFAAISVNVLAPVVYITPRPFDLLGPNFFPTRYLLLLFVSALFFIGVILDFDGRFSLTPSRFRLLAILFYVAHGISLYHNFIPKGSLDIKLANIGNPGTDFEGWWFTSISPMSLWILGLAASVGLLVGLRRGEVIQIAL